MLFLSQKKGEFSCHFLVTIGGSFGKKDVEVSRDVLDGLILSLKQTAHLCNLDCFENVCTINSHKNSSTVVIDSISMVGPVTSNPYKLDLPSSSRQHSKRL